MEVVLEDRDLVDLEVEYFVELELVVYVAFALSIVELEFAIAEFVPPESTLHHLYLPLHKMKEGWIMRSRNFIS